MSRDARRGGARASRSAATLPPSRPFAPHMRRFEPNAQFSRLWYREFAELLNPRHPSEVKLEEMGDDELGFSEEKRRSRIEKVGKGSKANYFIKDVTSGEWYFVKQSLNLDRLKREWLASQKFREHRIPSVLTAVHWFECQDEKSLTQNSGFIVFPFLSCRTLKEIYSEDRLTEQEWLLGLVSMTEVFAMTDPDNEESQLYLYHGDLHAEQIVFDLTKRRWFLVDFGNAKLSFECDLPYLSYALIMAIRESIGNAPPKWVDLDVIPGSNYTLPAEVEFARLRMLFKPGLKGLWRRVEEACKGNSRLMVLSALQSLYEELYGPLPQLRPTDAEVPEFNVLNGVNRVTATGVSYVEAAQLERKRAEERAKRNNKGFMKQVEMMSEGVLGSPPRRAAATTAAMFVAPRTPPKTPGKVSPKKSRPSVKRNLATTLNESLYLQGPVMSMHQATAEEQDEPVMIDSPPPTPHAKSAARQQSPELLSDEDVSTITLEKSKTLTSGLSAVVPAAAAKDAGIVLSEPVIVSDSSHSSPSSPRETPPLLPPPPPPALTPTIAVAVPAHEFDPQPEAPMLDAAEPMVTAHLTEESAHATIAQPQPIATELKVKAEESASAKVGRVPSLRDPSPEIAPIEIGMDSTPSHSSVSRDPSPQRTATIEIPPASPSTSVSMSVAPSPKRSKVQRLEEEALAWANRLARRAAATQAGATATSMSPPKTRASPVKSSTSPPKSSTSPPKKAPDVDRRVAEEALAWQRRLARLAEHKS